MPSSNPLLAKWFALSLFAFALPIAASSELAPKGISPGTRTIDLIEYSIDDPTFATPTLLTEVEGVYGATRTVSATAAIDTASLAYGTHLVYLRSRNSDGVYGRFDPIPLIVGDLGGDIVSKVRYAIDSIPDGSNGADLPPPDGDYDSGVERVFGQVATDGLSPGTHTLTLRAQDQNGVWGTPHSNKITISPTREIALSMGAIGLHPNDENVPYATADFTLGAAFDGLYDGAEEVIEASFAAPSQVGNYRFYLSAEDTEGATSGWEYRDVEVSNVQLTSLETNIETNACLFPTLIVEVAIEDDSASACPYGIDDFSIIEGVEPQTIEAATCQMDGTYLLEYRTSHFVRTGEVRQIRGRIDTQDSGGSEIAAVYQSPPPDPAIHISSPLDGSVVLGDSVEVRGEISLRGDCASTRTEFVFVIDVSLSISNDDLDKIQQAALALIDLIPTEVDVRIGLVQFGGVATALSPLTADRESIRELILDLQQIPGTNMRGGLEEGYSVLGEAAPDSDRFVLLFSDGEPNTPNPFNVEKPLILQLVEEERTTVHAVYLGASNSFGSLLLQEIAEITGGQSSTTQDSADLAEIFTKIGVSAKFDRVELLSSATTETKVLTDDEIPLSYWTFLEVPVLTQGGAETTIGVSAYLEGSDTPDATDEVVVIAPTPTPTNTPSPTSTPTETSTFTPTFTQTPTATRTDTPAPTSTDSPTHTFTNTPTITPTPTRTPIDCDLVAGNVPNLNPRCDCFDLLAILEKRAGRRDDVDADLNGDGSEDSTDLLLFAATWNRRP
ncbi:MAG: VWA domain-containing protein [Candidatus Omnitrophica bacterium]|nr:VWA domain-containing protein [Candidatus Omnitrophota bacterium]